MISKTYFFKQILETKAKKYFFLDINMYLIVFNKILIEN